uniref:C2H2-type domain-containing protein n=1 Tax=Stomoxys calcitrans TaxID=35570 RepID=A0A1I8Q076_STOCA
MKPRTLSSCVCADCWQELNRFHLFYTRVEEAHINRDLSVKNEIIEDPLLEEPLQEDLKPFDLCILEPKIEIESLTSPVQIEDESNKKAQMDVEHKDMEKNFGLIFENKNIDNEMDCESSSYSKIVSSSNTEENNLHKTKRIAKGKGSAIAKIKIPKYKLAKSDDFLKKHFEMICHICQQKFEEFRLLCNHYDTEHNQQGYALCCERKFFERQTLVDHIHYHLNPEYFKCKVCNKSWKSRLALSNHFKIHKEKKYCCDICDRRFVEGHQLEAHKATHVPKSDKKFPCNECGKFYATALILYRHQKAVHLKIYSKICDICGQTLPDSSSFKIHMKKHAGISITEKCDDCGITVANKSALKLHKKEKHLNTEKTEHKCHICSKISPTLRALKKHIHEVHAMSYQFKCTLCSKEFKRADNFKDHMSRHTGTPMYCCPWCPKTFNSNGNMHQHRKKIHPIEWAEERSKKVTF